MDNFKQVVEVQDVLDGPLFFEAREGRGVGIFSEACNIFLTFFFTIFFWLGIACARIFFYIKNKNIYILESTCSILPNGTRCITFFQSSSFGNCPKPPPLS